MEIVFGVDEKAEAGSPAEYLLRRLQFHGATIDVTHVVVPALLSAWVEAIQPAAEAIPDHEAQKLMAARVFADTIAERIRQDMSVALSNSVFTSILSEPSPAAGLMDYADRLDASLIAVNGPHTGPFVSLLTGSVARGLLIGAHRSLLIAKPHDDNARSPASFKDIGVAALCSHERLRVVFATDHSPYADRCLEKLIHFAPSGLSHITVLSALSPASLDEASKLFPKGATSPARIIRASLEEQNARTLALLSRAFAGVDEGVTLESHVSEQPVNDAIANAMAQTRADLLILGARGHGFVERLELGSVSFHQVMSGPYSVLVLRAD